MGERVSVWVGLNNRSEGKGLWVGRPLQQGSGREFLNAPVLQLEVGARWSSVMAMVMSGDFRDQRMSGRALTGGSRPGSEGVGLSSHRWVTPRVRGCRAELSQVGHTSGQRVSG